MGVYLICRARIGGQKFIRGGGGGDRNGPVPLTLTVTLEIEISRVAVKCYQITLFGMSIGKVYSRHEINCQKI